ncbi:hypothetical protein SXCC_03865 [Gluconacetobacter sp. SXCC-1]|nr:hypothetical protein SXCC_03865 [Gluconacetobacter sp. SXCC-1]
MPVVIGHKKPQAPCRVLNAWVAYAKSTGPAHGHEENTCTAGNYSHAAVRYYLNA